jgi:hypothetical protein
MSRDSDDDALRWEGDDDPTLAPGWKAVGNAVPATEAVDTGTDAAGGRSEAAAGGRSEADAAPQTGSVELVVLGVLGGVYLLYAVGWLIVAVGTPPPGVSIVGDAMYAFGLWLAVFAPALWYGLVLLTTKRSRPRLAWLVLGAIVLVPLPFVLGVTA